jgi:hypothetical protein
VFQRWVGYLNAWVAVLLVPGVLVLFFNTGPFAWNGVLVFWLAATAETIWFVTMLVVLRRAIDQQQAEEANFENPDGGERDDQVGVSAQAQARA